MLVKASLLEVLEFCPIEPILNSEQKHSLVTLS